MFIFKCVFGLQWSLFSNVWGQIPSLPPVFLSLVSANIFDDNTTDDTKTFPDILIFVFLCFGETSIIYYMIVGFGPYKMVSCDFQLIGHDLNTYMGLNGILCSASRRRQAHVFFFTWVTYTRTTVNMVDSCIPSRMGVFRWQRTAFQLRAADIMSHSFLYIDQY